MARSTGPTVGLDIGSNSIKVAEVAPARGGIVVRALGMAPTPPGAMENNIVVDAQLLGQAVKKLMKESGIGAKMSVSSVSGQSALVVRVIEVPKMSDAELAETMRWEVERHVPFAANEVIMDFQPIDRADTPPDAQNMEVLLAVAQQDMIDRHVAMLFSAGLTPAAVDVEPLAAARPFIELSPDPLAQKTVAIINIGASNTDIGIFRDGILAFPRTLPLAGDQITRALMAQMGISDEQAEDLKRTHGEVILDQFAQPQTAPAVADAGFMDFSVPPPIEVHDEDTPARTPFDFSEPEAEAPPPAADAGFVDFSDRAPDTDKTQFDFQAPPAATTDPVAASAASVPATLTPTDPAKLQVFAAIAPVISELLTELRRSMEYYRGRSADGRIDEIILCGGTAGLKNLDRFLEAELGIPTRVGNPLQYATVATKNYSQEYLETVAPAFVVAIGLASRDLVAVKTPVAAGPGRGGKKKKK
jgi:type IV pilus assembly protein PilM